MKDLAERLLDLIEYKVTNRETISKTEIQSVLDEDQWDQANGVIYFNPDLFPPKPLKWHEVFPQSVMDAMLELPVFQMLPDFAEVVLDNCARELAKKRSFEDWPMFNWSVDQRGQSSDMTLRFHMISPSPNGDGFVTIETPLLID